MDTSENDESYSVTNNSIAIQVVRINLIGPAERFLHLRRLQTTEVVKVAGAGISATGEHLVSIHRGNPAARTVRPFDLQVYLDLVASSSWQPNA